MDCGCGNIVVVVATASAVVASLRACMPCIHATDTPQHAMPFNVADAD